MDRAASSARTRGGARALHRPGCRRARGCGAGGALAGGSGGAASRGRIRQRRLGHGRALRLRPPGLLAGRRHQSRLGRPQGGRRRPRRHAGPRRCRSSGAARSRSGWKLSRDGLRMDLRSIVFDRRQLDAPPRRRQGRVRAARRMEALAQPLWPAALPQHCPIEVHEISERRPAAACGREGMPGPPALERGRVALTHRWTAELEASCLRRRTEIFVLEAGSRRLLHRDRHADRRDALAGSRSSGTAA